MNIFSPGINVPRRRFLPVKTTSDLLTVMSNLYTMRQGIIEMNPKRSFPSVPLVKLGTSFKKVGAKILMKFDVFHSNKNGWYTWPRNFADSCIDTIVCFITPFIHQ